MNPGRSLRAFCSIGLFWFACVMQGQAQTGSVREGYVIVTPLFGDQSRLSAFETFRYRGTSGSSQASVIDSAMTTNAWIFVTSDVLSGRSSAFAFVNPFSTDSRVTLNLYRADGSLVDTQPLTIHRGEQVTFYITELFPGNREVQAGFNGMLNVISSSNAIGIVGLRYQDSDFSTVPLIQNLPLQPMVPFQPNGAGGPGALLFPQFASGMGWGTEIVLSNTSIGGINVRVDVFDNSGVPIPSPFDSGNNEFLIRPNGVVVLSTATVH